MKTKFLLGIILFFTIPLILFAQPTTQATNIVFSATNSTQTTISWTNGDGTNRTVFIKDGSAGTPVPVDGTTYVAVSNFGTGHQIGSTGWFAVYDGTGSTVSITGLTPGHIYRVMVCEYTGVHVYLASSAASNPNNVLASFLLTPANNAVYVSIDPLTFTWSPVTGSTGYTLRYSTSPTFATFTDEVGASSPQSYTTDLSVIPPSYLFLSATKYYWKVLDNASGLWSETREFTTNKAINVTLYQNGSSISLSWYINPYSPGELYDIFYSSDNWVTNSSILNQRNPFINLTGLTPGTIYKLIVRAKNFDGTVLHSCSDVITFTTVGLPKPICNYPIGGAEVFSNPPTAYWYIGMPYSGIQYRVRYATAPGVAGGMLNDGSAANLALTSNLYKAFPAPLTVGATYYWQVQSDNGVTQSAWSDVVSFVVHSTSLSVAPTCYLSWPIGGASSFLNPPTFYWYIPTYGTGVYYHVVITGPAPGVGTAAESDNVNWINSLYWTPTSDLAGGTYTWRVQSSLSSTGASPSAFSAPETFVIPATSGTVAVAYPTTPIGPISVLNPTMSWYVTTPPPLQYRVRISTFSATDGTGMLNHASAQNSDWISTKSSAFNSLSFAPAYTLVEGTTYYWQVQSRFASAPFTEGSWSFVYPFSTNPGSLSVQPIAGSPNHDQTINNTSVMLSWILPTQSESHLKFNVEYSKTNDFKNVSVIKDLNEPVASVNGLDPNSTYYWRVSSKNELNGSVSAYSEPGSFKIGKTTSIENESLPTEFILDQNYPNPFNPTTIINYSLPTNSFVTLRVFDMLGREIKTLVINNMVAGRHSIEWKGDDNLGNRVSTGVYVYRISADNFVSSKKMLLIK